MFVPLNRFKSTVWHESLPDHLLKRLRVLYDRLPLSERQVKTYEHFEAGFLQSEWRRDCCL